MTTDPSPEAPGLSPRWGWLALPIAVVALGEWLRLPTPGAAVGIAAVGAALVAAWAVMPWRGARRRGLVLALALASATVAQEQVRAGRRTAPTPEQAAAAQERVDVQLSMLLDSTRQRLVALRDSALEVAATDRKAAFAALDALIPPGRLEYGVVILTPDGEPWAWGGRQRLMPSVVGQTYDIRSNAWEVLLETRATAGDGRIAVASVLVWAHPAVPERDGSIAEESARRHGSTFVVIPQDAHPPDDPSIVDYGVSQRDGRQRILFSARPVVEPAGLLAARGPGRARPVVAAALVVVLACGCTLARRGRALATLLAALVWVALRPPPAVTGTADHALSAATYALAIPPMGVLAGGSALLLGALALGVAVWAWVAGRVVPAWGRWVWVPLAAALPWVVLRLARGIHQPGHEPHLGEWFAWQGVLFLASTALLVLAALAGPARVRTAGRWGWAAVALAAAAVLWAAVGIGAWRPDPDGPAVAVATAPRGFDTVLPAGAPPAGATRPERLWPPAYAAGWALLGVLVAGTARARAGLAAIVVTAGALASVTAWGTERRHRLDQIEADVGRLQEPESPIVDYLLDQLSDALAADSAPRTTTAFYVRWRASTLARDRYPAHLALWSPGGRLVDELPLDSLAIPGERLAQAVRALGPQEPRRVEVLRLPRGSHKVLVQRLAPDLVATVAVGPRTELIPPTRLGRLIDPAARRAPLYRLTLADVERADPSERFQWVERGDSVVGTRGVASDRGWHEVRATLAPRDRPALVVRGALFLLGDSALVLLLWALARVGQGAVPDRRQLLAGLRSFRGRLGLALALFAVVPTAVFAGLAVARLGDEAEEARRAAALRAVRNAALAREEAPEARPDVAVLARRIGADIALYEGGRLGSVSAPILRELGILGDLLPADAYVRLVLQGERETTVEGALPRLAERVGYRRLPTPDGASARTLAAPVQADAFAVEGSQRDLVLLLVLVTALGVVAAVFGAGGAVRTLARPVEELRQSALAIGRGEPLPVRTDEALPEFAPVFGAFDRMAADLQAGREALEAARRRTAEVLATVATGVIAIDHEGLVTLANVRAQEFLGRPLELGRPLAAQLGPAWARLAEALPTGGREPRPLEFVAGARRYVALWAPLGPPVGGCVLALNDVTDLSRAQRVLAWGEMARQVAHEIKNPLTPMRLGVQHLQRAWRDGRPGFGDTLEETTGRILQEIDRLDRIARSFSRLATPGESRDAADRIDLRDAAAEVVRLYGLAPDGVTVVLEAAGGEAWGTARRDELKEVLINLVENARQAEARHIVVAVAPREVTVRDDGEGIAPDDLERVFEPRFSTRTSGSGLGLAIVKRLVEGWGASVTLESAVGRGTTVRLALAE